MHSQDKTFEFITSLYADGNPALLLSVKYMRIRSLSLIPQMVSYVCFSAFRGMMGTFLVYFCVVVGNTLSIL